MPFIFVTLIKSHLRWEINSMGEFWFLFSLFIADFWKFTIPLIFFKLMIQPSIPENCINPFTGHRQSAPFLILFN